MIDVKNISVSENKISFSDIVNCVKYVVNNSYDKDGVYHEYLYDFHYLCMYLGLFTNYDGAINFDEIMGITLDPMFGSLCREVGAVYDKLPIVFKQYCEKEIEERNKPFAKMDGVLKSLSKVLTTAEKLLSKIDETSLEGLSIESLVEGLSKIGND